MSKHVHESTVNSPRVWSCDVPLWFWQDSPRDGAAAMSESPAGALRRQTPAFQHQTRGRASGGTRTEAALLTTVHS